MLDARDWMAVRKSVLSYLHREMQGFGYFIPNGFMPLWSPKHPDEWNLALVYHFPLQGKSYTKEFTVPGYTATEDLMVRALEVAEEAWHQLNQLTVPGAWQCILLDNRPAA